MRPELRCNEPTTQTEARPQNPTEHHNRDSELRVGAGRSPPGTLVYLYLAKGPRSVWTRWWAGPGPCRFPQNSLFSYSKTTNFSLRRGPRAVSHTPLGRPWGRIGLLELPKEAFGASKYPQSGFNSEHFMFSRQEFKGRLALNEEFCKLRESER